MSWNILVEFDHSWSWETLAEDHAFHFGKLCNFLTFYEWWPGRIMNSGPAAKQAVGRPKAVIEVISIADSKSSAAWKLAIATRWREDTELWAFNPIEDATFVSVMSSRSYRSRATLIGKLHLSPPQCTHIRHQVGDSCSPWPMLYSCSSPKDNEVVNTLCIAKVVWTKFFVAHALSPNCLSACKWHPNRNVCTIALSMNEFASSSPSPSSTKNMFFLLVSV